MKNKRALAITVTLLAALISLSCAAKGVEKGQPELPSLKTTTFKRPQTMLRITRAVPIEKRIQILERSIVRWKELIKKAEGRAKKLKGQIKETEKQIRKLKRQKKDE